MVQYSRLVGKPWRLGAPRAHRLSLQPTIKSTTFHKKKNEQNSLRKLLVGHTDREPTPAFVFGTTRRKTLRRPTFVIAAPTRTSPSLTL